MEDGAESDRNSRSSVWLCSGSEKDAGVRRGTIYELFILGELMGGPHHGYLLREILTSLLGPFQQMSWGTLYPLIRQLEQGNLIEAAPTPVTTGGSPSGRGRQRSSYQLTASGRERFYALIQEPHSYSADFPDLFIVKLNYFGYITPAQRIGLLQHHRGYLQAEKGYLEGGLQNVAVKIGIPEDERAHILRMLDFRLSGIRAQLVWIDHEIQRLTSVS